MACVSLPFSMCRCRILTPNRPTVRGCEHAELERRRDNHVHPAPPRPVPHWCAHSSSSLTCSHPLTSLLSCSHRPRTVAHPVASSIPALAAALVLDIALLSSHSSTQLTPSSPLLHNDQCSWIMAYILVGLTHCHAAHPLAPLLTLPSRDSLS